MNPQEELLAEDRDARAVHDLEGRFNGDPFVPFLQEYPTVSELESK